MASQLPPPAQTPRPGTRRDDRKGGYSTAGQPYRIQPNGPGGGGGVGGDNRVKHEQGMRNAGAAAWKFKLSHNCREDHGPNCIPGCKVLLPDLV